MHFFHIILHKTKILNLTFQLVFYCIHLPLEVKLNLDFQAKIIGFVQQKILLDALRYYSELADKTVWSFFYFAKNCKYIYLDKNVFRNGLRIIKRFCGVLYWHFYFRKKILGSEQKQ